jgi:hypothetical protein
VGLDLVQRGLLLQPLGIQRGQLVGRVPLGSSRSVTNRSWPAPVRPGSSRASATTRTRTGDRRAGRSPAAYRRERQDPSGSACSTSSTGWPAPATAGAPRGSHGTPQRHPEELPVGQHQHPRPSRASHPRRQRDLAHPHPSSSASTTAWVPLHQRHHAYLRKRSATLDPVGAGTAELLVVGWRVGRIPARAVHRHQPQALPERSGCGRRGQRPGRGGRQHPQRLRAQPLPGARQRRLGRQPPTLLGPVTRGHHPIHQVRWIHPGQHPEPRQLRHTLSHRHHPQHRASSHASLTQRHWS